MTINKLAIHTTTKAIRMVLVFCMNMDYKSSYRSEIHMPITTLTIYSIIKAIPMPLVSYNKWIAKVSRNT